MREVLVKTGKAKIVEDSEQDPYWGGVAENSKNVLGLLMMELRERF